MIHDRLVTKNGFLLHTSWGLAPSPFPSGHPKNAFLGWFCNTYWITVQKRVQTIYVLGAMLICSKSCLYFISSFSDNLYLNIIGIEYF